MKTVVQRIKEGYSGDPEGLRNAAEKMAEVITDSVYYFSDGSCLHDHAIKKPPVSAGSTYTNRECRTRYAQVISVAGGFVDFYMGEDFLNCLRRPLITHSLSYDKFVEIYDIDNI